MQPISGRRRTRLILPAALALAVMLGPLSATASRAAGFFGSRGGRGGHFSGSHFGHFGGRFHDHHSSAFVLDLGFGLYDYPYYPYYYPGYVYPYPVYVYPSAPYPVYVYPREDPAPASAAQQ